MKILVVYGTKPTSNSLELVEKAKQLGHEVYDGPTSDMTSKVSQEGSRFWIGSEEVSDADLCMLRSFGPGSCEQLTRRISLLEHMEVAGIRVMNPCYPFRRARDKYATQYVLLNNNLPVAETVTTESLARAYEHTSLMDGNIIYKPILSSMGKGSMRFENTDLAYNAYKMLDRMQQPFLIQRFIQNPGRDIRVFVIGGKIAGAVYKYIPEGGWKSNVAQGGKMVEEKISQDILELGLKATKAMKLDYCGVDIIEGTEGPVILEVNAAPGWQGLKEATGLDIADKIIRYAEAINNE
jgi:RimK family alpha-L-glutamate ligase